MRPCIQRRLPPCPSRAQLTDFPFLPLDETGFQVTVYERRASPGGIWDLDPLGLVGAKHRSGQNRLQHTRDRERFPATLVFDKRGTPLITWSRAAAAAFRGEAIKPGTAETEEAKRRPPSAIYEGLRTNIPCDLMSLRDTPFRHDAPLFPHRAQVLDYIQDVARTAGLHVPEAPEKSVSRESASAVHAIAGKSSAHDVDVRFQTRVTSLYRSVAGQGADSWTDGVKPGSKWSIVSERLVASDEESEGIAKPPSGTKERVDEYDHVIVASGRCNTPSLPFIPGLWNFRGTVLHSAWYRTPYVFARKNVIVVGNASSGFDICREMAGKVCRVLPFPEPWERENSPFLASLCNSVSPEEATEAWVAGKGSQRYGGRVVQSVRDVNSPPALDYDPRDPASPEWARRIRVVPRIDHIEPPDEEAGSSTGKIFFTDGSHLDDVDVIIFATGFYYEIPFLDQTKPPFNTHPIMPQLTQSTGPPESQPAKEPTFPSVDDVPNGLATDQDMGLEESEPDGAAASLSPKAEKELAQYIQQHQNGHPFHRLWPTASGLQNLDQWQLFYRYDDSLAILGLPLRIVPFPLTQAQARYLLQYWAGKSPPLSKIDPSLPSTDEKRWVYRPATTSQEENVEVAESKDAQVPDAPPDNRIQHDLGGALGDISYVNGLVRHINPSAHAVEGGSSNGLGDDADRQPENWDLIPVWRQERRLHGKSLRRRELGY